MARLPAAHRRDALVATAAEVVLARGLARATTRDVTDRLSVGAGLLNHYFTWSELRVLAFERIVNADINRLLPAEETLGAKAIMDSLVRDLFAPRFDPVWRVWIEAAELAGTDPALEKSYTQCWQTWRVRLAQLLARGSRERIWRCDDPDGASWRLAALVDGLVGLTLLPDVKLGRDAARRHFAVAMRHECAERLGARATKRKR
jgi:AcrR family transcriptional regulator